MMETTLVPVSEVLTTKRPPPDGEGSVHHRLPIERKAEA